MMPNPISSSGTSTFSKGLEGVIAGETRICYIDSEGNLKYRGYDIQDLAQHCTYEEVAHLLLFGELPTAKELAVIKKKLFKYRKLPKEVIQTLKAIPKKTPTMDVLRTAVSLLSSFDPIKTRDAAGNRERALWLISSVSAIIAARYRILQKKPVVQPKAQLSHAGQFLYQITGKAPDPVAERTLDLTLILYAEHEFNASTFTARVIGSTLSDLVSSVVGGIGALKGPLHGGANEEAMLMLKQFKTPEQATAWVKEQLATKGKIMGFGHRVYKHGDHRAKHLEVELRKLAEQKKQGKWMAIYDAIKNVMVTKEKPIYPNVDYPCGLTYYILGLPLDLYTPLFVAARTAGWCAHFIEQMEDNRIYRPLSHYVGPESRTVASIKQR